MKLKTNTALGICPFFHFFITSIANLLSALIFRRKDASFESASGTSILDVSVLSTSARLRKKETK